MMAITGPFWVDKEGRAGSPLPAAARTECMPYHPRRMHH